MEESEVDSLLKWANNLPDETASNMGTFTIKKKNM